MPTWTGYFSDAGDPVVRISISGPFRRLAKEFEVTIDTGFSGFLSIPLLQAFPLGLILTGSTSVRLADGSVQYRLTALAVVFVDDETEVELVILEPRATAVLAGMQLLRVFRKKLVVSLEGGTVLLEDESPQPQAQVPPA
ncbi:MAG: hypothetical protein ACE5MH_06270 [Terriglobia bacterium]